jgi:hypothetical protein
MENLELKKPIQFVENYFRIVGTENQPCINNEKSDTSKFISASEHQANLRDNPGSTVGASHEKAELISKTHYNPHDPDARISIEPGKARKLNYNCSISVDMAQGIISHIKADFCRWP